jgi:hypothetical protein
MTTLPADEDYAKAMLTIFSARGVRAGQSLKANQVGLEFESRNMGRPADYEAALSYAADRGWLRVELGRLRLTEAGSAEA